MPESSAMYVGGAHYAWIFRHVCWRDQLCLNLPPHMFEGSIMPESTAMYVEGIHCVLKSENKRKGSSLNSLIWAQLFKASLA